MFRPPADNFFLKVKGCFGTPFFISGHMTILNIKTTPRLFFLCGAFVVLLVGAVYAPVLNNEYVWDDLSLFVNSPVLRDVHDVGSWWSGVSRPILPDTTYFRPAVLSTFVVEFFGGRVNPALSHLVNLMLFLANVTLTGLLVVSVQGWKSDIGKLVAITSGMLFYGLHPANTEATAWVSGRFDLMVTLAGLLYLLSDKLLSGYGRLLLMGVAYFIACNSKEMAVVFPIVYVCLRCICSVDKMEPGKTLDVANILDRRFVSGLFVTLVSGCAYLVIRGATMPSLLHADKYVAQNLDLVGHVVYVFRALWFYISMVTWPFGAVSPQHPLGVADIGLVDLYKALGAALILVGVSWCAVKARHPRLRRWCIFLLLAMISLLPVLHVVPLTIGGNIGHERFLTWPLCLIALLVADFSAYMVERRNAIYRWLVGVALSGWLICSAAVVESVLPKWRSDVTLWNWAYSVHPDSGYVQASLMNAFFKNRMFDNAEETGKDILARAKGSPPLDVVVSLAQVDLEKMRIADGVSKLLVVEAAVKSEGWAQKLLNDGGSTSRVKAVRSHLYGLLSGAYLMDGQSERALAYARMAVKTFPESPNAKFVLARAEYAVGNWEFGQMNFYTALREVSEIDRKGPLAAREKFLSQKCEVITDLLKDVCTRWRDDIERHSVRAVP